MASTTQREKTYSCDSSFYTYNKSTDRISSPEHQEIIFKLNNIKKQFDGVNSTIQQFTELDGLNNVVIMLAHWRFNIWRQLR